MYMKSKYEQFFTIADTDPQLTKLVFCVHFHNLQILLPA